MKVRINDIKIGKRIRRDIGDLETMKKSLRRHGLINPIIINSKGELIAGFRRLSAAKDLGWLEIDAITIDPGSRIQRIEIEMEENIVRKEFTPNELMDGLKQKKQLASNNIFIKIWNFIKRLLGL